MGKPSQYNVDLNADRADYADPHRKESFRKRLEKAGAVDLRDNRTIETLGDGYVRIRPIDPNKRYGDKGAEK